MMVFFHTRLEKFLIWQKFSETWESDFKLNVTWEKMISFDLKNYVEKKTNTKTDIQSIIAELLSIGGRILAFLFIMK